jgi:hypothetical protein
LSSSKLFSDSRIPIVDGKVTCSCCGTVLEVKQIKGRGVHDAKNLVKPTEHHIELIEAFKFWLSENNYITSMGMSAEEHRLQLKRYRYIKKNFTKEVKQSHFQRTHSELLYWGILIRIEHTNPPEYRLEISKADHLLESRRFQ